MNPCPCCQAHADVARLTAERDADRACAAGFAAELSQAHDLLASAVLGGPLSARIRALLSLWSASVVEKAKLQREVEGAQAEIDALKAEQEKNKPPYEGARRAWIGRTVTRPVFPFESDSGEESFPVPANPSERPQDAPGRNDGAMTRTEDRTCPACRKNLEEDSGIESLSDFHFDSQGRYYIACPHCGVALKLKEEDTTNYYVSLVQDAGNAPPATIGAGKDGAL